MVHVVRSLDSPFLLVGPGGLLDLLPREELEISVWRLRCAWSHPAGAYEGPTFLCGRWTGPGDIRQYDIPILTDIAIAWAPIPRLSSEDDGVVQFASWETLDSAPEWARRELYPNGSEGYWNELEAWREQQEPRDPGSAAGPSKPKHLFCHHPVLPGQPWRSEKCSLYWDELDTASIPPQPW